MNNLPGLIVDIEARIDKLEKGLKRANSLQKRSSTAMERRARVSADRMRTSYGKAGSSIEATFKKLGPALIGGLTVGALGALSNNLGRVINQTAQIGDEAKRAGVSVQALQEWSFIGKQNRIGIDQIVDGLKELNLRADEFIVTGKGPAAEAFARLGYGATDLKSKLENPSELLLEIIGRLEDLDTAAQIRVSDEIFGGSAGERFVELVGRGEGALRKTIKAANDTGQVLDASVIEKAAELDRRFAALQTRVGNFFKRFAVGAAGAVDDIVNLRRATDSLFAEHSQTDLEFGRLGDYANTQSAALLQAANTLRGWGYDEVATALVSASTEMRTLTGELEDGTIRADEFEKRMSKAATTAQTALGEIDAIDKAEFSNVITGINGLITRLGTAATKARELRASLPNGGIEYAGRGGDPRKQGGTFADWDIANSTTNAPTSSRRPSHAPTDPDFGLPPVSTGGGGGSRSQSDYQRELESITEETAALHLEAQALAEVTGAQTANTNAVELAKTKAELLAAAQRSGMADTPQLRAQIDALAGEYNKAGNAAELAADKIREVQNASRAGAQSVADVFGQMATGAISAQEAVRQLILQIIQLTIKKRILAAIENSSGGGFFGGLLKLIGGGFAAGGYTGDGSKYEPAGVVHKGEYVMSAAATKAIGVPNLEALHTSARKGYSGGGLVSGGANTNRAPMSRSRDSDGGSGPVTINAPITVNGSAGTPEQNNDLSKRMAKELEGIMRGVVCDELRKQQRPGNLMNNRRR